MFCPSRVFVADSLIKGAGEGLFAKADAEPGTVMAFYNGVRITHSEVGHTVSMEIQILLGGCRPLTD